ncbi:MAG: D-tyrosyl-tRNA(Tyr) deacylase, partial [Clostridia bacterium]|nr:D-tyrosyl-tRNA(Tyr) deacylase [Clostridia bacterium]
MKVVIQRVSSAKLSVEGELISEIGRGLVVYFGVSLGDYAESAAILAAKISKLRIFEDGAGKMNLSISDEGGEILSVSQFTLLADTSRGNRPSFTGAEKPERAKQIYEFFCEEL